MAAQGEKTRRETIRKSDMDEKPQMARKHSEPWDRDLSPNRRAAQTIGAQSAEGEHNHRTAYDLKDLHGRLAEEFNDDELKTIPVIPEGQRLQQGGIYIDLKDPRRKEFTATGDMSAEPRNLYTSKSEVPYELWNRLIGVANPDRLNRRKNGR